VAVRVHAVGEKGKERDDPVRGNIEYNTSHS